MDGIQGPGDPEYIQGGSIPPGIYVGGEYIDIVEGHDTGEIREQTGSILGQKRDFPTIRGLVLIGFQNEIRTLFPTARWEKRLVQSDMPFYNLGIRFQKIPGRHDVKEVFQIFFIQLAGHFAT